MTNKRYVKGGDTMAQAAHAIQYALWAEKLARRAQKYVPRRTKLLSSLRTAVRHGISEGEVMTQL